MKETKTQKQTNKLLKILGENPLKKYRVLRFILGIIIILSAFVLIKILHLNSTKENQLTKVSQEPRESVIYKSLKRCDINDSYECYRVGLFYLNINKLKKAEKFFKLSCDLKYAAGCYKVGYLETK